MEDSMIGNDKIDLDPNQSQNKGDKSHLIVWQVSQG